MIEVRPRYVAQCASPDDVVAALAFAREQGFEIAVRAGGHSVAGASLVDDGVVLDVRLMGDVDVDPVARIVRVGAGATWAKVDAATQAHGLATTGGRVSTTGVAGLTLGGGSGWLERKHGLACDNVLAVELVTADGRIVRATADQHPDLFWALRGGGGNFGVVTAFEFRLHEVGPEVMAGVVIHPVERGRELMALWRDVMLDAPDELSLGFAYFTAPDIPEIPAELRGRVVVGVNGMYAGDVAEGEKALRELRAFGPPAADLYGPMPYVEFQQFFDIEAGYRNWWSSEQLPDLPDEAIDVITARSEQIPAGVSELFCVAWGGAVGRVDSTQSPLGGRDMRFIIHPLFLWENPSDDEQLIDLGRGYRDDLAPWASGSTYLNFNGDEGEERVRAGFGEANHERLARVKAEWDPENVFRNTHNVRPAAARKAA